MPETFAVAGAGLIGRAWAIVFARAGARVRLWDGSPAALDADQCRRLWDVSQELCAQAAPLPALA